MKTCLKGTSRLVIRVLSLDNIAESPETSKEFVTSSHCRESIASIKAWFASGAVLFKLRATFFKAAIMSAP